MFTSEQKAIIFLKDILKINTSNPPGNELILAEYFVRALREEGIEAWLEPVSVGRANFIACLPGQSAAKKLMYTGHLDTVPAGSTEWIYDPFAAVEDKGRLYGRGASDCGYGLSDD